MKTFFNYCYYRIAKGYKNTIEPTGYCIYGSMVLFGAIGFYILTIVVCIMYFLKLKLNNEIIIAVLLPFSIIGIFYISKKRYEELAEKYKNEKYSKLKGWLVFLYVIGSLVVYMISLNVFKV